MVHFGTPCSAFCRATRFIRVRIMAISCSLTAVLMVAVSTPLGVNRSISPLLGVASRMPRSMNRPLYARKSSIIRFNRSWCQAPPHHE